MSTRRRALIWILIVAASLLAIGSALAVWVDRQMLGEEAWKDASTELIEDPAVREAVSVYPRRAGRRAGCPHGAGG
jgi:hypothetical protein